MTAALLELSNLSYHNQGVPLLQGVSLNVRPQGIISIVGPNGGGKTTLARLMAKIIKPQSGYISRAKHLKIGYVPQHFERNFLMPMSAGFFLQLSPYASKAALAEVREDLALESLLPRQLSELSGGEKQRVLLARAILGKPNLLILDEPTKELDLPSSLKFYELISSYARSNACAVVLISHDLNFVMSSTDEVLCLNRHVCCQGTPQEIGANPAYVELFGKDITESLALYKHQHNHSHQ